QGPAGGFDQSASNEHRGRTRCVDRHANGDVAMTTWTPVTMVAIALSCAFVPAVASAQSKVTFVPSLSLSSVYDDNLFARTVGSGDQMTQLTPGVEFGYDTSVVTFNGQYSFDMERSLDHAALDNIDARRRGLIDVRLRKTPRLAFGFVGRYDRTETAGEL